MNKCFKDIKIGDKLYLSEQSFLTTDLKRELLVTDIEELTPERLLFTVKFENSETEYHILVDKDKSFYIDEQSNYDRTVISIN